MPPPAKHGVSKIQAPKGTRDLYPEDALKRRYLEQCWRDASVRCGFEEIHGPTFETTDLYAVKSGEGILGELFQAYSGKAPEEVEQVKETGRAPYAMRPEFTPTLARMFAAKAGSLPRPCKWFTGGPYFRAERPQRGRLREFLQWNVDVIGLPGDLGSGGNAEDAEDSAELAKARMDAECVECCISSLDQFGFTSNEVNLHSFHRQYWTIFFQESMETESASKWFAWLDAYAKRSPDERIKSAKEFGASDQQIGMMLSQLSADFKPLPIQPMELPAFLPDEGDDEGLDLGAVFLARFANEVSRSDLASWVMQDPKIVRGLAYYTGTVFEVLAEGERAIAGGGRYDKLIELMGGPPTPAVGFAMGDVVVSLLLEDKGLMPQGAELMEAVSRRPASVRPEVFVVGADDEHSDALVRRLSADLRRGVESDAYRDAGERKPWSAARYDAGSGGVRPMHARVSYKSTRNVKKLINDGDKQFTRLIAVVHGADRVELKDRDRRRDFTPADIDGMPSDTAEFSVDPASPVYVGRAAERVLG